MAVKVTSSLEGHPIVRPLMYFRCLLKQSNRPFLSLNILWTKNFHEVWWVFYLSHFKHCILWLMTWHAVCIKYFPIIWTQVTDATWYKALVGCHRWFEFLSGHGFNTFQDEFYLNSRLTLLIDYIYIYWVEQKVFAFFKWKVNHFFKYIYNI
jgi:hypothetical protein